MANDINKTFVTLAPWIRNVDLCKDVGMIPYCFHKKYRFKSVIVTSKNDNYSYLKSEAKGLQLEFITSNKSNIKFRFSNFLLVIKYLFKKGQSISILNLYHIRMQTAIWAILFKIINPRGKIYLKCDTDSEGIINIRNIFVIRNIINLPKKYFLLKLLQKTDLITIETNKAFYKLDNFLKELNINPKKCFCLPNGFDVSSYKYNFSPDKIWAMKENIILSVGRIGTKQKNTEMVLETFIKLNPDNWKLVLIGPIEKQFTYYIENFYKKCPKKVKDKIIFAGPIYDKAILYKWYCKSKIFYLPSRWEGFSLALIEAMFFMNYLVASRLDCTLDITNNGEYGRLVKSDDLNSNLKGLNYAINLSQNQLFEKCDKIRRKVEREYNWDKIVEKIFLYFYSNSSL